MDQPLERHSSGLVRSIGIFSAVMIVVSAMIGSGVFKKVAPMSAELGSGYAVLAAWIAAGLVTLCGALTNAEIAGIIAEPGGQYKYFEKMYGRFFAYLYGWASFSVVQTATTAAVAYVFAQSINFIVPIPNPIPDWAGVSIFEVIYPFENFGVKMLTIFLIAALCLVNASGVKYGVLISNIFASAVTICIAIIVVLGFGYGDGGALMPAVAGPGDMVSTITFSTFFAAMLSAFWAYEGWNTVGFMGGEIQNPQKNIPRALVIGVGLVMAVYVTVNAAYLYVLPVSTFAKLGDNDIAAVSVVQQIMGSAGIYLILGLIIAATFNTCNNTLMSASRVWFAMAHDGLFHGSAKKLNKKEVPGNAIMLMGVWSSLLVLSGSFDQLTNMLVFAAFIFYGAGAAGVFILRKKMPDAKREYKVPFYPVLPALFVIFCTFLVVNSIITEPRDAGIGLLLILLGVPFYKKGKLKQAELGI